MDGERDVLDHHKAVRNSNTSEYDIDGVKSHVPVCEYYYVCNVEEGSKSTDGHCKLTMDWYKCLL